MKKVVVGIAVLLLVTTFCFAQTRNPAYEHEGKTAVGMIEATGMVDGTPGYIMLRGAGQGAWRDAAGSLIGAAETDATMTYYLWVSDTGKLMLCSYTTISGYSSFPTGRWTSGNPGNMPSCTVVGSQS